MAGELLGLASAFTGLIGISLKDILPQAKASYQTIRRLELIHFMAAQIENKLSKLCTLQNTPSLGDRIYQDRKNWGAKCGVPLLSRGWTT